jgi:hypothetical protein
MPATANEADWPMQRQTRNILFIMCEAPDFRERLLAFGRRP